MTDRRRWLPFGPFFFAPLCLPIYPCFLDFVGSALADAIDRTMFWEKKDSSAEADPTRCEEHFRTLPAFFRDHYLELF